MVILFQAFRFSKTTSSICQLDVRLLPLLARAQPNSRMMNFSPPDTDTEQSYWLPVGLLSCKVRSFHITVQPSRKHCGNTQMSRDVMMSRNPGWTVLNLYNHKIWSWNTICNVLLKLYRGTKLQLNKNMVKHESWNTMHSKLSYNNRSYFRKNIKKNRYNYINCDSRAAAGAVEHTVERLPAYWLVQNNDDHFWTEVLFAM